MAITSTTPREAAEVVGEATRTAAEASRRTIEGLQAAAQAGRTYWDESTAVSRKLFTTYVAATEATMKAAFQVQNAAFTAGGAVFTSGIAGGQEAAKEWAAAAVELQKITLDMFEVGAHTLEKAMLGTPRV